MKGKKGGEGRQESCRAGGKVAPTRCYLGKHGGKRGACHMGIWQRF